MQTDLSTLRLADVPGIGAAKLRKLRLFFGSDAKVFQASPAELRMFVSPEMARRIRAAVAEAGGRS